MFVWPLLAIAAASAGAYLGAMAWHLAMHGQLASSPWWYVAGVPAALLLGVTFYAARRRSGGAQ